ncbi:hypothetical protein CXG81DRAFT_11694, partial [Caulochytrium protostelioides]
ATITFSSSSLGIVLLLLIVGGWMLIRYRYLTSYSRQTPVHKPKQHGGDAFDLQPDITVDHGKERVASYSEDLMGAFLSSVKIFGYLDKPVFQELSKNVKTRKVRAGEVLHNSYDPNQMHPHDFYIVVDGVVDIYVRGHGATPDHTALGEGDGDGDVEDDPSFSKWRGYHLLNHVTSGGTVSSLFNILSILTDDAELPIGRDRLLETPGRTPRPKAILASPVATDHGNDADESAAGTPCAPPLAHSRPTSQEAGLAPPVPSREPIAASASAATGAEPSRLPRMWNALQREGARHGAHPRKPSFNGKDKDRINHQIVVKARSDATLAYIPGAAFRSIKEKFPVAAAHIVQVILTRFQRVTFRALYRYMGLSQELLKLERNVNEFVGYGLPDDFFLPGDLERLPTAASSASRRSERQRANRHHLYTRTVRSGHGATPRSSRGPRGDAHGAYDADDDPLPLLEAEPLSPIATEYRAPAPVFRGSHPPPLTPERPFPKGSTDHLAMWQTPGDDDASDLHLKEATLDCIIQILGVRDLGPVSGAAPAPGGGSSPLHAHRRRSVVNHASHHASQQPSWRSTAATTAAPPTTAPPVGAAPRRFSVGYDSDTSDTTSVVSGVSQATGTSSVYTSQAPKLSSRDIQLMSFPRGATLIEQGSRGAGLFFVIDGLLEAHMNPNGVTDTVMGHEPKRRSSQSRRAKNCHRLFPIQPGGLAGYLSALTGHPSFVSIRAQTDCYVGWMPKHVLDQYVERFPSTFVCLAKRLVNEMSPLVLNIDTALEWSQVNAGQVLCRQGDQSSSIYLVLNGRLRAIRESSATGGGGFEIQGEYGQGESVGELEVLTSSRRPATIHAIRDTEIAIIPKRLFNALALQHPEITLHISKLIATRLLRHPEQRATGMGMGLAGGGGVLGGGSTVPSQGTMDLGKNNVNLRTVAVLPVTASVPVAEFAVHLEQGLKLVGAHVARLDHRSVSHHLGRHAFSHLGRLKLMQWLADQEETHRMVLYVADGGVGSAWTQRCIRQADCILLVGLGDEEGEIGEFERLLIGMKTTARKELVLLHAHRQVTPGSTAVWLKNRLWIHAHHHVQMMSVGQPRFKRNLSSPSGLWQKLVQASRSAYRSTARLRSAADLSEAEPNNYQSDFARLSRRLLSRSIGLVLGGGGARGIAHLGILRAFEEAGIPVDMVGGTSIGSFIGGLYAIERDSVSAYGRAKMFSGRTSSLWRMALDLTYPFTALTTGHEMNRGVWKCFKDTQIEDCWLNYFAVTTNITWSRMDIHTVGYIWRYVRASMTLCGYLPPVCDNGNLLVDGGYVNNLPADIMRSLGAETIIAIDVGNVDDTTPVEYGDTLSGLWVLLQRWNPFADAKWRKVPAIADIQSRLAYVTSVQQLEAAKRIDGCCYLKPNVSRFGTLEFGKFDEILEIGYQYGKDVVAAWERDGTLAHRFGIRTEVPSTLARRNSL